MKSFMNFDKKKLLMQAFVISLINNCPLVWMFHNRTLNKKINRIHEKALRIVYNDGFSLFSELLCQDESVSMHHRNLRSLAIELYKIKREDAPEIMRDTFPYNQTELQP